MRLRSTRATARSAGLVTAAAALVLAAGVGAVAVGLPQDAPDAALTADAAVPPAAPVQLEAAPLPVQPPASRSRPLPAPRTVAPLTTLRAPDLVVTARRPVTPAQLAALKAVRKVTAVVVVDAGTVQLAGRGARLLGVDPSTFRAFTPQETAASDALWQSVARGELAPAFGLQRTRKLALGSTVTVVGRADVARRVGAVAAYGLPGVDAVTDRGTARALGVVPDSGVVLSAPDRGIGALKKAVRAVLGADAVVEVLRAEVVTRTAARPRTYRELYVDSARYCPGLSWTVLAAIGQVESGHGRNLGPSSAGALGPMQFLPSTWAAYGLDGDGDGRADILSPYDAIPAAAGYLCRSGANRGPDGLYDAIFAYNHADWYVRKVLALAAQYR